MTHKFVMLEVDPETLFVTLATLCEMTVRMKKNPNLLNLIPDDPTALLTSLLETTAKSRKSHQGKDTHTKEELDTVRSMVEELLAKVRSK